MAIHTELPIYRTGAELLALAFAVQQQLPRGMKRILGEKIVQHCVEMSGALTKAYRRTTEAPTEEQPCPHA